MICQFGTFAYANDSTFVDRHLTNARSSGEEIQSCRVSMVSRLNLTPAQLL